MKRFTLKETQFQKQSKIFRGGEREGNKLRRVSSTSVLRIDFKHYVNYLYDTCNFDLHKEGKKNFSINHVSV